MAGSKYNAPDRDRRRKTLRDLLKKAGGAISTEALHVGMEEAFGGFSVRTTRRDLEFLAGKPQFAVRVELPDRKRRYWKLGRGSIDLALTPPDAMTLTAILQHADRFGFRIESDQLVKLRNYAATEVWSRSKRNMIAEGRITSGTRFMVLKPGDYNADHLITIQKALENDQSLKIVYRPRDAVGAETCLYYLKPLALSHQDSNVYLSAYVAEETWPEGQAPAEGSPRGKYSSNGPGQTCVLMLHRMVEVQAHLAEIPDPPGYDVHSIEVQKDLMTIHGEKDIGLELRLSDNLQNRLSENPLTDEQVLIKTAQGWSLKCHVRDSQGLRLFLLSNAADIQVVAPASLRNYIYGVLKEAIAKYSQD